MAKRPQVLVRPGLNAWSLLRTDRDGAKQGDIPRTAAAAVRYFLGEGLSPEPGLADLVPVGPNEWRFGDVRPLRVIEVSREAGPALPAGGQLQADRMNVPDIAPTVGGKRPWWVVVWFWWRGPQRWIDYPGVRAGLFWPSWTLVSADWLLDRAVWVPEGVDDPGAYTWAGTVKDKAQAAFLQTTGHLGDLLLTGGQGLAIAALLYLLLSRRGRR